MNEININKIDLNLLKSLRVLLEEQNVGNAAKRMNVTQSAMSHTLSRLRTVFDDPLFVRNAKGLEPTSRALELSGKLRFILEEIDNLLSPKELDFSQIKAHFRIQTHDFIVATYLATAIRELSEQAPKITFDIQLFSQDAYKKLDEGKLDMVIGAGLTATPRLIQKRLAEESLMCLLDRNNPILNNWNADAIFRYPHIRSSMVDDKNDPVTQYGMDMGLPDRKEGLFIESFSSQLPLIPNSKLIAFLPASIAKHGSKVYDLHCEPCPFPLSTVVIRGLWHERHQSNPVHQWIRTKISDAFKASNT